MREHPRKRWQKKLPHEVSKALGFPHLGLQLTEEEIRLAMSNSDSNASAAKWMGINYETYRKFAMKYVDPETGKTLFEVHRNKGGRGKKKPNKGPRLFKKQMDNMLTNQKWSNPRRIALLRNMLILHGRHSDHCQACGYDQRRLKDDKLPLMLHFINGDKHDWHQENLKWLCYNCYFVNVADPFSGRLLREIESSHITQDELSEEANLLFYGLDEFFIKELENMTNFVHEGRFKEADELIDYVKEEQQDLIEFTRNEVEYTKKELDEDENNLISRRV